MPEALTIELCSPQHAPVELDATEIVLPGASGVLTVLPGHTAALTALTHGVVIVYDQEDETASFFAVHEGFAEILGDRILVLADVMEPRAAIDEDRAKAALERATGRLEKPKPGISVLRAEAALARARARLRAHDREE